MNKGVLLFAFNNGITDYYKMAEITAKRVNHFLNLPVTLVTDELSIPTEFEYIFDNVLIIDPQKDNKKQKQLWINKGRYQAYDLTPYDETLLIDTDYLINSNQLLKIFDIYDDFMCPNKTYFLLDNNGYHQEQLSPTSFNTLWATIIAFKKTNRTKQIFECMRMVQYNYSHYVNLYNMYSSQYRNDHALAISCRIINGQIEDKSMYLPWSLVHANDNLVVEKLSGVEYNTSYKVYKQTERLDKTKIDYCIINDMDFHLLDKNNFMKIV